MGVWEIEKRLTISDSLSRVFSKLFPSQLFRSAPPGIILGPQRPALTALEGEARRGSERVDGGPERGKTTLRIYFVTE